MDHFDQEKTLADYWNILVQRWYILAITVVIAGFISVVQFRSRPTQPFPFLTAIELGDSLNIDSVTAKTKIEYILRALLEHANKESYEDQRYAVDVEVVEGSNIITLRSTTALEQSSTILGIHQSAVDQLLVDHAQVADGIRRELERQKLELELALDVSRKAFERFPDQERDLKEEERLAKARLIELKALQESYRSNRTHVLLAEAGRDAESASLATALLLIDADVVANFEKIQDIETRLAIGFPKERRDIVEQHNAHERVIAGLERDLENFQHRIDTIKHTQMLIPPTRILRSARQVSFRGAMGIAVLIGLVVGAMMVFFLEFMRNARKLRLRQR